MPVILLEYSIIVTHKHICNTIHYPVAILFLSLSDLSHNP